MLFANNILKPIFNNIKKYPERNAFFISEKYYSYRDLGIEINKIRFYLNSLKIKSKFFGIVTNDDLQTYASIIALWSEGKAFVPINPKNPYKRNKKIINTINLDYIFDTNSESSYKILNVINPTKLEPNNNILNEMSFNDITDDELLTYILFTSGSTGEPKGVKISRKNISSFFKNFWESGIKISKHDRCLQSFDLTFDVSIQCFIAPLINGACIYTVPNNQIKYSYIYNLLENQDITFAVLVPSLLGYLRPYFSEILLKNLKNCIITAESCSIDLALDWINCIPNCNLFNYYGPTELTIYCSNYKINKRKITSHNGMLSIGKLFKNLKKIIIDENGNILPNEKKGELCISGDQVSPGYWNDTKKNNSSFFTTSFEGLNRRFYKTGDICSITKADNIILHGRIDTQIKIDGYRIEIGEIEFISREYLKNVNIVIIPNKINNNYKLTAFIESKKIDTKLYIDYLRSKLPAYMIPSKVKLLEKLPLNSNDKTDKIALKKMLND